MPVERISRGFKDISMSFEVNPINDDLITVKNRTAIARSIRNLIFTVPGERFFNPILGSEVRGLLFDFEGHIIDKELVAGAIVECYLAFRDFNVAF